MSIRILHNPRCSKSRQTLAILEDSNCDIEIIDYLNDAPRKEELEHICKLLSCSAEKLVRKKEALFKSLSIDSSIMSESDWLDLLSENPKLIDRPIVIKGGQARIGRPPEAVLEIIGD